MPNPPGKRGSTWLLAALALSWGGECLPQTSAPLPSFDFTQAAGRAGWTGTHDISALAGSAEGLVIMISGGDPYLSGPARDFGSTQALWLRLKLRSEQGGTCQVFYYTNTPTESDSVRFSVPAGTWVEGRLPIPALGPGFRMRIDPPGTGGQAVLAGLSFEDRSQLPDFDFGTVPDAGQWSAAHDISKLEPSLDGLRVVISGSDPYLFGPSRNYPANELLWLNLRLRSEQAGTCQVFYFADGPTEENSVRFTVPAAEWFVARVPVPAFGPNFRLRIDPPGTSGECVLSRLWLEPRVMLAVPSWPRPAGPALAPDAPQVQSGPVRLRHSPDGLGAFVLDVNDQPFAIGNPESMVGYIVTNQVRWLRLNQGAVPRPVLENDGTNLVLRLVSPDSDGGTWTFLQRFSPGTNGVIEVESEVTTDRDRDVVYLPLLSLLPGVGTFGTNKNQALFAGLEYLEDEPSSSVADVEGAASWRQVPNTLKSTFPLMAIEHEGRYLGMIWEPRQDLCAVFDSPDRQFGSGGHLMGLLFPGSDGSNREERSVLPYGGRLLKSGVPLRAHATIIGGLGGSVVPAVQHYVRLRGLPPVPDPGPAPQYFDLAAHGWLDSRIRETNFYRHAFWPGFNAQPASDAAFWELWLSRQVSDPGLAARLTNAAAAAIAQVSAANYNGSQIGHVRFPAPALIFGSVLENAVQAVLQGRELLGRFQPDGTVVYQPQPGGLDYGRTHWARHANGLTASVLASVLEHASFSGDQTLIEEAIKELRLLDQYRDGVPRGAQTWEIPLHTPDILASAYLVKAYTRGYELTGTQAFLEQARYWAWTGVPFVYLQSPVSGPVGPYATIPVLGATAWKAPVWIGLPVQWCGLVYGEALYGLAAQDPEGPWQQIADGIAASGIQQSWGTNDVERQGLLPDSFVLPSQHRDGPAINPATVQAPASRLFRESRAYDFRSFLRYGLRVHAPGQISKVVERPDSLSFYVRAWSPYPYRVLVNGARQQPKLRIDGQDVAPGYPHQYLSSEGRFVIYLTTNATVTLLYPARQVLRMQATKPFAFAEVAWPLAASNSILEFSRNLASPVNWLSPAGEAVARDEEWVVTVPLDHENGYFRLRQPVP